MITVATLVAISWGIYGNSVEGIALLFGSYIGGLAIWGGIGALLIRKAERKPYRLAVALTIGYLSSIINSIIYQD